MRYPVNNNLSMGFFGWFKCRQGSVARQDKDIADPKLQLPTWLTTEVSKNAYNSWIWQHEGCARAVTHNSLKSRHSTAIIFIPRTLNILTNRLSWIIHVMQTFIWGVLNSKLVIQRTNFIIEIYWGPDVGDLIAGYGPACVLCTWNRSLFMVLHVLIKRMLLELCCSLNLLYYGGCWMLESDWLTNVLRCAIIFRETHGERSSRHRITCPYHFAKWFALFQGPYSLKQQKNHNPQQHWPIK